MVSVICTAYNHEKYIRQCLDGFVMQKTDFKYEVIVHDDASTDSTPEIIREYQKNYPDIIKPILQTENQYSKGIDLVRLCMENVNGRYIAFCEGDDFWTDEYKLQKQFEAMESNPSCKMCLCKVRAVEENAEKMELTYPNFELQTGLYKSDDILKVICKEYAFQTSSYFVEKETLRAYYNENPEFLKVAPVGDWPMLLYFSQFDIYYIDDEVSCYRKNSVGSFSTEIHQDSSDKVTLFYKRMCDMMDEYDKYTEYKYHNYCQIFDFYHYFYYQLVQEKNYKDIFKNKSLKKLLKKESRKDRIAIMFAYYCPWLIKVLDWH